MWTKGTIDGYSYCIKHFEECSIYGIEEGRISKMEIRKEGKILANYDRGWDIEPQNAEAKLVCEKVLKLYN